jgi:hypothetical protein
MFSAHLRQQAEGSSFKASTLTIAEMAAGGNRDGDYEARLAIP